MQNFLEMAEQRISAEYFGKVKEFYDKVKSLCLTNEQKQKFEEGQQNTIIILPLELDYDMIFAGLILPLLRAKLIDESNFEEYASSLDLAKSVLTIESVNYAQDSEDVASVRSMLVAMAKDIRAIILELASVLNQERHSKQFSPTEKAELHKKVVDIHIPLASRLGLSYIKSELQDLDLAYTHPNEYRKLMKTLAEDSKARESQIEKIQNELKQILIDLGIKGEVFGRIKHVSSIFNKIEQKNYTLNNIYDIVALRVLVGNVNECYSVLGAVHTKYTPLDGRFKDYIARPKANGYQSLHTTVLVDEKPLEIQIRTFDMHYHAEYGIAAHFLYKEHKHGIDELDGKLLGIKKLIENPNLTTSEELIDELKTDVYSGKIFVQTPMGKILELPEDSTPIDFAYAIHSNIGNKCVGAKINGKMVPLNKTLKNADVVEILTSVNAKGPSKDWLNFVKTNAAKNRINQFFKHEMKDENIKKGKAMLEQSAKAKEVDLKKLLNDEWLKEVFDRYSLKSLDDMYAMIGCAGLTTTQILNKLIACYEQHNSEKKNFAIRPVEFNPQEQSKSSIAELNSMLIKFAHCCKPVPGDDIIGFVSRGRGVTIHRADCKAIKSMDADRLMPLTWNRDKSETNYQANIRLVVKDKSGVLANIANKLAEEKINIASISSKPAKDGNTIVDVVVSILNKNSLDTLMKKLKNLPDVYEVFRGENV